MAEQNVAGYSTPYRFTGKELDEETGLYYFGARYYDPSLSIFHGVDAWAEKYPQWSPFTYTMNNPIRFIDPTGNGTEEGDPIQGSNIFYLVYQKGTKLIPEIASAIQEILNMNSIDLTVKPVEFSNIQWDMKYGANYLTGTDAITVIGDQNFVESLSKDELSGDNGKTVGRIGYVNLNNVKKTVNQSTSKPSLIEVASIVSVHEGVGHSNLGPGHPLEFIWKKNAYGTDYKDYGRYTGQFIGDQNIMEDGNWLDYKSLKSKCFLQCDINAILPRYNKNLLSLFGIKKF